MLQEDLDHAITMFRFLTSKTAQIRAVSTAVIGELYETENFFDAPLEVKVNIEKLLNALNHLSQFNSNSRRTKLIANYWQLTRPNFEWLDNFQIKDSAEITFSGVIAEPVSALQYLCVKEWTVAFIKRCFQLIRDLPTIIEQKGLDEGEKRLLLTPPNAELIKQEGGTVKRQLGMSEFFTHLQKATLPSSKYRILGLVGQGQFGRVFCAIHRLTGRLAALKELERQRFPTHKFLREMRFLLSLQHPNIVNCQALEHTQTGRYLVLDYCEGGTLRNLIQSEIQLSLVQSLKLIADVLAGLEHAHGRGIVHCDIKPENILLSLDTTGWIARISDFGIARLSQELCADHLGDTGSPAYMAPERFYGQYSPASDLYAVGVLLFEMAVGHRPFSGLPGELMSAHLNQPVKIPNTVPFLVRSTISTALQKLPTRRFASAAQMLKSIRLAAEVESATQRGAGKRAKGEEQRWGSRGGEQRREVEEVREVGEEKRVGGVGKLRGVSEVTSPSTPTTPSSLSRFSPPTIPTPITLPTFFCAPLHPCFTQLGTLQAPVTSLAVTSGQVYQANGSQVRCQTYASNALVGDILHQWLLQLIAPVQALILRPQGCLALTKKRLHNSFIYSVYCLPRTQSLSTFSGNQSECSLERYQLLSLECTGLATAIDPQGRWIAIAKATVEPGLSGNQTTFQILKLPNLQPVKPPQCCHFPSQLLALDSRHGIAIFTHLGDQEARGAGTVFQVFTRRGSFIGALNLPVSLRLVTLSATFPYRLFAIDQNNPTSALLIDLKPFRVFGIELEIAPAFIVATCWGYIIADRLGEIVLLDRDGQRIGNFRVPAPPSAIATFEDYGLLIATWSVNQDTLYRVDLRQLHQNLF